MRALFSLALLTLVAAVSAAEPAPPPPEPAPSAADARAAESRIQQGDTAFQALRYEDALAAYQEAARLNDRSATAFLDVGVAEANLGRLAEAMEQWRIVLELDPRNVFAKLYLGKVQHQLDIGASHVPYPAQLPNTADLQFALMNPRNAFGRDALVCAPPGACSVGDAFDFLTFGHSTAGYGLGVDARLDMTGFLHDESPLLLNADLGYWGFISFNKTVDVQVITWLEAGVGVGLPRFREHHVTPFVMANVLSFEIVRGDGSDLGMYRPNLQLGVFGPRFGLSVAGGVALFGGDGVFQSLGPTPANGFNGSGVGPFGDAESYVDIPFGHAATLRLWARVEGIYQSLNQSFVGFETVDPVMTSRVLLWGRAAAMVRVSGFTVGAEVAFISPDKQPELSASYAGVAPETTVQLVFGYHR